MSAEFRVPSRTCKTGVNLHVPPKMSKPTYSIIRPSVGVVHGHPVYNLFSGLIDTPGPGVLVPVIFGPTFHGATLLSVRSNVKT